MLNRMKFILLFFMFFSGLFCEKINVFTEVNKYLQINGKTRFEIDYQIPNKSITFTKGKNKFLAQVKVDIFLVKDNEIKYQDHFINKIGAHNFQETVSENKFFIDKLKFSLSHPGLKLKLVFTDLNNQTIKKFEQALNPLELNSLVSNLEFSTKAIVDTSENNKFLKRGNIVYLINPSHIYSRGINDSILIYCELYNNSNSSDQYNIQINVTRNDTIVDSKVVTILADKFSNEIIEKLPLDKFNSGYYKVNYSINAILQGKQQEIESYFVVKDGNAGSIRFFTNLEDEYKLLTYFISPKGSKIWRTLNKEGKINYLNKYWRTIIANNGNKNNFINMIRERIVYTNKYFSVFKKGWLSDRGRILIRNGKPDSVDKETTDLKTKYTQKEFQIWKYRGNLNKTYIFIDLQNNGNYQLIYSDNDDFEMTNPNWEKYLGDNFDKSELE